MKKLLILLLTILIPCIVYAGSIQFTTTSSGSGEANTASNTGSLGTGLFKQKTSVDLEFYKIYSANNILTTTLVGTDYFLLTANENNIDHDALTNFLANEHFAQSAITTTGTIGTGTWEGDVVDHERGGLEIDASAFNGLLKITGGTTSAITDSSTNWDTAYTHSQDNTQAHSDYLLNTTDTMTGPLTIANTLTLAGNSITGNSASINFSTGVFTGSLTGNADTATALETARNIAGVSFDGTADIEIASTGLSDTASIVYQGANIITAGTNLKLSSNAITGTTAAIDFTNFDVLSDGRIIAGNIITGTQFDSGNGNTEIYNMNQDVESTDAVTFSTVDTGFGANELYDMNQHVQTTDNVDFNAVNASNVLTVGNLDLTSNSITGTTTQIDFDNFDVTSSGGLTIADAFTFDGNTQTSNRLERIRWGVNDSTNTETSVFDAKVRYPFTVENFIAISAPNTGTQWGNVDECDSNCANCSAINIATVATHDVRTSQTDFIDSSIDAGDCLMFNTHTTNLTPNVQFILEGRYTY